MVRNGGKGAITVWFSLFSVLFIALICSTIESVRIQGARAQTANITDMGNYSVFGEYEKRLLEDYEVFAVDVAGGTGDFSIERVNDRLKVFLSVNANPKQEILTGLCFDPWNLQLNESSIREYALLSDDGAEPFYQQVVAYMKGTALAGSIGKLYSYYKDAQSVKSKEQDYQKQKNDSGEAMKQLEAQEAQKREELEKQAKEEGVQLPAEVQKPELKNPLEVIRYLQRRIFLELLCGVDQVSEKSVGRKDLLYKRSRQKGTMKTERKHTGLLSDLLYREYLLDHFPAYSDHESDGVLDYQIEYIIAGKRRDEDNLKGTIERLLLVRETMNYLYCVSDPEKNAQAGALAAALIGWTGIPPLIAVMKHALLLAWAYGESLMDIRILMDGGRVPLQKSPASWVVDLDHLAEIQELLRNGGSDRGSGMDYKEYLRILLNLQGSSEQKKRGLEMLEQDMRKQEGLSEFHADYCMIGMKDQTQWTIRPVFQGVAGVFLHVMGVTPQVEVESGFAYH